jgi:hypothetical protein
LGKGVHNLDTGALKWMLVNSPAPVATNSVKADLTEISAGNGYTAGGHALTTVDFEQTSGTAALSAADLTITASGGSIGPFRYVVLYNDTPTSPADPLIGFYDYGSSITLLDTESLTIDVGATILTIA